MIEPLQLSIVVDCAIDHAFAVWTEHTSAWWPADHTVTVEADLEIVFEPRVDGRIFERTRAGREIEWGQITVWEPPRRLGYLWHLRTDRADATDVEISFTELHDEPVPRTRVDIEHRGWDRLGDRGAPWRERNIGGWTSLLPWYEAAIRDGVGP